MIPKSSRFSLLIFFGVTISELTYVPTTNNCTDLPPQVGSATYCPADPYDCIDGTPRSSDGSYPSGSCKYLGAWCYDGTSFKCPKQSSFFVSSRQDTDAGVGQCHDGANYQNIKYYASCCACPTGTVVAVPGCAYPPEYPLSNFSLPEHYGECAGCSQANETLVSDGKGGFSCTTKCPARRAISTSFSWKRSLLDLADGSELGSNAIVQPPDLKRATPEPANTKCKSKCPTQPPGCDDTSEGGCKMNSDGTSLLKSVEGCCLGFYNVRHHPTIGIGHDTTANKDYNDFNPPLTYEQVIDLYTHDIAKYEKGIGKWQGAAGLNSNQFSAIVSVAFNAGLGGPKTKRGAYYPFHDLVKNGSYQAVCDKMSTAAVNPKDKALLARRKKEQDLCNKPTNNTSGCI